MSSNRNSFYRSVLNEFNNEYNQFTMLEVENSGNILPYLKTTLKGIEGIIPNDIYIDKDIIIPVISGSNITDVKEKIFKRLKPTWLAKYLNQIKVNQGFLTIDFKDEEKMNIRNIKYLNKQIEEAIEKIDTTIENEINSAQPKGPKNFETNSLKYSINTGDYDYANNITVEIEEKLEIVNGNDPDREAMTTEIWYADGEPALKCTFNTQLDGPAHPDKLDILNADKVYDILISFAAGTDLFNNQV